MTQLARCEYIERRENVIAIGNSGTGKTHIALGLGLAACQKGLTVGFTTASALVNELMEARDEMRLLNLQARPTKLLIIRAIGEDSATAGLILVCRSTVARFRLERRPALLDRLTTPRPHHDERRQYRLRQGSRRDAVIRVLRH